jgi:hypothetical protein
MQDHDNETNDLALEEPAPVRVQEAWQDEPELPPRPRRRLMTPLTASLLGVLLAALGFIGGVLVQKGQEGSTGAAGGGAFASRLAGLKTGARAGTGAAGGTGAAAVGAAREPDDRQGYVHRRPDALRRNDRRRDRQGPDDGGLSRHQDRQRDRRRDQARRNGRRDRQQNSQRCGPGRIDPRRHELERDRPGRPVRWRRRDRDEQQIELRILG